MTGRFRRTIERQKRNIHTLKFQEMDLSTSSAIQRDVDRSLDDGSAYREQDVPLYCCAAG